MEIDIAAPPPTADASPADVDLAPKADAPPSEAGEGSSSAVEETPAKEGEEKDPKAEKELEAEEATPKESAITRSLRKREAALVERQAQMARAREDHEGAIKHFNEHVNRVNAEVAAFRADQQLAKNDPVKFIEKTLGTSFEDVVRTWMNGGKQPLEQQVTAETKALREELAQIKRSAEERDQREKSERAAAEARQIDSEITSLAADAAKFPTLSKAFKGRESALVAEVKRVAQESAALHQQRTGKPIQYTPAQVLAHIEKMKLEEYKNFGLPTQSTGAVVAAESAAQTAPKSAEKTGQKEPMANGKTAPTLTGKGASQRAAMPKADPLSLDPEEEKRRVLEAIENARKAQPTRAA